jgi:hypothetical protein
MNQRPLSRSPSRPEKLILACALLLLVSTACSSVGTCVGSGGDVLLSPVCKDGWSRAECQGWDAEGINGASWDFRGGATCEGLGYTDRCSDGSYRLPGDC